MPSSHLVRAFFALWWTLGILLAVYSAQTAWQAFEFGAGGADLHVAAFASVEAIAALVFLVPRTMRAGGVSLLVVFALAFALHAAKGEFASQLLLYAAGVGFVTVHGRARLGPLGSTRSEG